MESWQVIRPLYSNPPRHGAAIVVAILSDPQLYKQWRVRLSHLTSYIFESRTLQVGHAQSTIKLVSNLKNYRLLIAMQVSQHQFCRCEIAKMRMMCLCLVLSRLTACIACTG